ncbi:MAG: DUF86 domain-containing protein [Nitrospirae bacterium]|nr:MAG: DUF86 domain-containing protein [Nitrospirota bacterium]
MMVDILSKVDVVRERVSRLREYSGVSFEKFLSDYTLRAAIERNLEVAIQGCIDIAKIIIKRERLREPEDNKGTFVVLAENGLISEESLKFLLPMAGTRNILVHGYDKVDESIIFGIIRRHLEDFDRFLCEIDDRYLKKH